MTQADVENRAMRASQIELEAVVAVARTGGFRAAARELGMASSALSHAVAALETRLGVRLFNRTTRSVALSAEGEQFVADVAPALAGDRRGARAGRGESRRAFGPAAAQHGAGCGAHDPGPSDLRIYAALPAG